MAVIYPPTPLQGQHTHRQSIFLAGSIDNGAAENWQARVETHFADRPEYLLLNPRRAEWDATWEQTFEHPRFYQQVNWELNGLDAADHIILYFAPASKAPVSLLELGLYAASGKVLLCCPEGYWRRGNVQVVSERYRIPFFDDLDELLQVRFG